MGGDRRRTSHSIEVPLTLTPQHNSRKRPPSYIHECGEDQCNEEEMNECNAALILMKLSNSPKSPKNADKWLGSSPGSSSASWSSGSSSPPLSDDGHALHTSVILNDPSASARMRTTSVSTSDEGIVVDFKEDAPRRKRGLRPRFLCTWKGCKFAEHTLQEIELHIRNAHLGNKKPRRSADYDDHEEEFYYTEIEDEIDDIDDDNQKTPSPTSPPTLSHRDMARPPHEDPEYQRQIVGTFKQGRVANLHNQQQHHSNIKSKYHGTNLNSQNQQMQMQNNSNIPTSPLDHHNYTWSSTATVSNNVTTATSTLSHTVNQQLNHHQQQQQQHSPLIKHARSSPRPSQSTAPYPSPTYVHHHHHNYSNNSTSSKTNCSSNNNSPIIQNNNVLHQLSQQNVTVTAHHSGNHSHQHQQQQQQHQQPQQQQLSAVTITPNYHQNIRGINNHQQSPTTTANSIVATANQNTSQLHHQQHAIVQQTVATSRQAPNSPNRRTRGENKKCRKVYGMERKDQWCTQCRWKKACSRFGD